MRKGFLVPYGCIMFPLGSVLFVPWYLVFSSGGYRTWFLLMLTLTIGIGLIEALMAYEIIGKARLPSVQRTKHVMWVGFFLFAISLAV